MQTARHILSAALALLSVPMLHAQSPSFSGGAGTESDPYLISSKADLEALASAINQGQITDRNARYRQTVDIDLASEAWTPIGTAEHPFIGYYDGYGHSISHLLVSGGEHQGLFGYVGYQNETTPTDVAIGQVWNVMLQSGTVSGSKYVGGIAGYVRYGSVFGCANYGCEVMATEAEGATDLGGICGHSESNSYCMVMFNYNGATVSGAGNVGGICGYSEGQLQQNLSTGAVTATGDDAHAGAIVGYAASYNVPGYSGWTNNAYASALGLPAAGQADTEYDSNHAYTAEELASGDVKTFLNEPDNENVWVQKVGTDEMPKLIGRYHHGPSITLSASSLSLYKNELSELTATTEFAEGDVKWTSSNSYVRVDKYGHLTGVASGTATITATVDGVSATCSVSCRYDYQDGQSSHYYISNPNPMWFTIENGKATVTYRGASYTSYNEYSKDVEIPNSIWISGTEYPVTCIGNDAFYKCSGMKSIIIPNSVTVINLNAFRECI